MHHAGGQSKVGGASRIVAADSIAGGTKQQREPDKEENLMDAHDMEHLKDLLLAQRREIFRCSQDLAADWQALSERDVEKEEEAQKADLSCLFEQLDNREQEEIKEIDRALAKIATATYGSCEQCRKPIGLDRLEALPATRWCSGCARRVEEQQKMPQVLP